jgi:hypothetical protein
MAIALLLHGTSNAKRLAGCWLHECVRISPETDGGLKVETLSFVRRTLAALAACAALCAMPVAKADTLQTITWAAAAPGYEYFSVTTDNNIPTGGFKGIWNGHPIIFWCYELTQYFSLGGTYTNDYTAYTPPIAPPSITPTQVTELSELFTEAFAHALDSDSNSAAFQLAIWKIEYETAPGPLNLGTGNFDVTNNFGNTAAVTQANYWLAHLPNTGDYVITELYSPDHQNFIYGTFTLREAPEPSLLSLLGIALAALTLVGRWQSARRRGA